MKEFQKIKMNSKYVSSLMVKILFISLWCITSISCKTVSSTAASLHGDTGFLYKDTDGTYYFAWSPQDFSFPESPKTCIGRCSTKDEPKTVGGAFTLCNHPGSVKLWNQEISKSEGDLYAFLVKTDINLAQLYSGIAGDSYDECNNNNVKEYIKENYLKDASNNKDYEYLQCVGSMSFFTVPEKEVTNYINYVDTESLAKLDDGSDSYMNAVDKFFDQVVNYCKRYQVQGLSLVNDKNDNLVIVKRNVPDFKVKGALENFCATPSVNNVKPYIKDWKTVVPLTLDDSTVVCVTNRDNIKDLYLYRIKCHSECERTGAAR